MKENTLSFQKLELNIKSFLKQGAILFLVGGVGTTLLFGSNVGVNGLSSFIRIASFQGTMWIVLWMGNGILSDFLDRKISWLEKPELRFMVGVLMTVIYTVGSLAVLVLAWNMLYYGETFQQALEDFDPGFFITALLITALISMFLHGRAFLLEWRTSASEAERLKSENLAARYETLKNQVNPHFLFNSFNVLSSLVYKDQDKAAKFIKQLSNVYRYVLETKDKETVQLEEEIEALLSFSYLSEMRFGENLSINIDLAEIGKSQIAPMTLQMLMENAIKHNIISKAKPLKIEVFYEKEMIVVQNNLQRKSNVTASTGIGLQNIKARYKYLSEEAVRIIETKDLFIVKIPMLKL